MSLSADVRISDLVGTLADPVEYITGILANFASHCHDPEMSSIRIGRSGFGIAPNYKIERPSITHRLKVMNTTLEMIATASHVFCGRNQREMVELYDLERHDEHWSTSAETFGALKALLSQLSQSQCIH